MIEPYFETKRGKLFNGDVLEVLKTLPSESVQCCVTSPPYWGMRDYQVDGQLGLERIPEEYIAKLIEVFREVRRVLKKDGTFWLNLGDSYANTINERDKKFYNQEFNKNRPSREATKLPAKVIPNSLKPKDLVGIPWRVALALQADGWWLRSDIIEEQVWMCPCCGKEMVLIRQDCDRDIIWHKPNPMPESVTDRPTKSHEYLFLLSKNERYYYDVEAIKEPAKYPDDNRAARERRYGEDNFISRLNPNSAKTYQKINKRSIWTIPTQPYPGSHFAVFPPTLIEPCILAGSKPGDIILDPFMGSGTVAVVAEKFSRQWAGIELNPEYCRMAKKRIMRETRQLRL